MLRLVSKIQQNLNLNQKVLCFNFEDKCQQITKQNKRTEMISILVKIGNDQKF